MKHTLTALLLVTAPVALAQQKDSVSAKRDLRGVEVTSKTGVRKIREQAYTITAIDARALHNTTANINQVLNRTSGIRIREEGGLGSSYSFSLNGFTGKQVRFFLDGVPIDNFGSSLSLNNLPVNMAERIEVYKGVVPVHLGADALGGAVNVVTNDRIRKYLDVSYSYGSFNTHLLSLNSRYTTAGGLTIGVNAFRNYSDNNYRVDVQIPDVETGIYGHWQKLRRFNDQYRATMGQVEVGVVNKKFADKLLVGFIASENKKDVQTGINMEQVAGMVFNSSSSLIPTLKYKKTNLFTEGLSLTVNANYSAVKSGVTDTSSRQYDWTGSYTIKPSSSTSGEIYFNKTQFRFRDRNALATANLSYSRNAHALSLNHAFNRYWRKGEDPISKYPIPFDVPNIIAKNITGLAYTYTAPDTRWSATAFAKRFGFSAKTVDASWGEYEPLKASHTKTGYGAAVTYFVLPWAQLKASYENTWRLPDGEEMFGNGLLLENNPSLKPEHSHNINAGVMVGKTLGAHRLEGEFNYIYRKAGDFIRLSSTGQLSRYENLDSVRTSGFEWAVKYAWKNALTFEVNSTYQNTLDVKEFNKGLPNNTYWDRLPNIPYLFGNADLGYRFSKPFGKSDMLSVNAGGTFVEAFYLYWPSQGDAAGKFNIPRQVTGHASVTYSLQDGRYNLTVACTNITDATVYDNFRLQKPGRAFNVKLRYFLH